MLCGQMSFEKGCLTSPKSPASTAGNSTFGREPTSDYIRTLFQNGLQDEVLISNTIAWDLPLSNPEETALLSRAIGESSSFFTSVHSPLSCLIAWRLFQAADRGYNGFVTRSDLQRVLLAVFPSCVDMISSSDETSSTLWLYWDVLVWWDELDLDPQLSAMLERNVLKKLVVPSDGLWAGVGLSASLRIWKTVCYSVGCQFRYCAQNYLQAVFREPRLDVIVLLMTESLSKISPQALSLWKRFIALDTDSIGYLNASQVAQILRKPSYDLPPTYLPRSLDVTNDHSTQYSFVHVLDNASVNPRNLPLFPTQRCPAETSFTLVMKRLFKPDKPISLLNSDQNALQTYAKQYLDIEQWRGQYLAQCKS